MYKEVLRSIEGVDVYPIISLTIFGLFFTILLLYVWKVDNHFINEMKQMPFQDEKDSSSLKTGQS